MAAFLQNSFPLFAFVVLLLLGSCHCTHPAFHDPNNATDYRPYGNWSVAVATWYGEPDGPGSNGGACGFGDAVGQPPLNKMVTAVGPSLYQSGQGCGGCYQVKCTSNAACSGNPVTVTITDECPGCEPIHFDLSGFAFGAMAIPGQASTLRNVGRLQVEYRRVRCNYPGTTIAFHVDRGSNPYYLAFIAEYGNGDGELASVEIQQANSDSWIGMQRSWGAVWKLNWGWPLSAPLSVRLTSLQSRETVVAKNVIPAAWTPGATYRSLVNFGA